MLHRVRLANRRRPQTSKNWWTVVRYKVSAVVSFSSVVEVLRMPVCRALPDDVASQRLNNAHLHRIASLVSACLGCCDIHANSPSMSCLSPCWPSLSAIPSKSFVVSPSALVRVGFPWRHQVSACPKPRTRAAIAKWGVRRIDPAGLATLLLPGAVGKLVYIEEDIKELDWSAISASIDSDPSSRAMAHDWQDMHFRRLGMLLVCTTSAG